jgi:hypothetical protein
LELHTTTTVLEMSMDPILTKITDSPLFLSNFMGFVIVPARRPLMGIKKKRELR